MECGRVQEKEKQKVKSVYMAIAVILITVIVALCMIFCIHFIKKSLLKSDKTSAENSAQLICHNFSITDEEVEYMKSLTFNEMEIDPINQRLAGVATGTHFSEPIISIYLVAPLDDSEIKYSVDAANADFWEKPIGTKLNAVWLLNMAVDEKGEAVFKEREDIYRYTVITDELQQGFSARKPFGIHSVDEWGNVITGYSPVYTTEGSFVGLLGVDFDYSIYSKELNRTLIIIASVLFVSMTALVLLFFWLYERYSSGEKENRMMLEAEKASLSSMLDNILVGIYVYRFDKDNISIENANSYVIKMLGRDSELIKKAKKENLTKYVHPDDMPIVHEVIDAMRIPNNTITREYRLFNKNTKEYVWLVAKGQSVGQSDGSVLAYVCYIDVSDRKRLQNVENALKVEQASSNAKTEFLSTMSHDMRTPMNGILGLVTLMMDRDIPAEIKSDLHQIQLSGKYLLNLINDTLDLNKIAANKLELHPVVIDAHEITENVVANAEVLAKEKGVAFEIKAINPEKITPSILFVDAARVQQICLNLISNAIKFTPAGGMVCVTIERLDTTEDYILNRYQVIDTGIGMSEEFLKHLYEPFMQEGKIATRRDEGTGIGLAIVHRLIELMNGQIEVSSIQGEGTTFTVTLCFPRYKGKTAPKVTVQSNYERLRGIHVLLVEDHPLNRQIAVKLLEKKGMIVDTAENGEMGVRMYQDSEDNFYSVILMDIRMPVMDGLTATKEIRLSGRADAATIPIIAMTANAFDDDVKACMDAGMNDHISKPIDVEKMYRAIVNQLGD